MAAPPRLGIQMLLEAAEFLERREREAEHGYASLWPGGKDGEAPRRRAKARRSGGGGRSTHNEMEKNRRAQLRLCLERLKGLVPLGASAGRHTTLSLLTRARLHIQKLEDQERRALHQIEQLQREQRHLQRQLEKLGMERVRIDSIGSSLSSERSDSDQGESPRWGTAGEGPGRAGAPAIPVPPAEEMDVDVESTDDLPADLDWSSSSPSDSDERGSLQSLGSDEGYSSSGGTRAKLASGRKLPVGV
ncbi:max dimerization protein 1 isoform X1 [Oenanthe melanoleuca]|uniref:max dimerization protein 1 isoform X1 n=1 Tax=Oenanthe melanoleuca TaxID=2939378 RepID=UPI0024C1BAFB|nr:max dimerization protein 1 isoform X1 [Oenanthe melanoleuca]